MLAGWLLAIPIPFILINASNWSWVIFANVLLGVSQGLTWSSTVVMKIDLVGEKDRGFAMGLNEFAGYFAVGIIAFLTGYVANKYGVTPYPFYIGIFIAVFGFILTFFWVKDTRVFVQQETSISQSTQLKNVFWETTLKNKTLSSVTQAGLINNLNDGMIWGLLPIVLLSLNYNNENIGLITAIYPTAWGIGQLFTGKMSDHYSKKAMLFWGMLLQGLAILFLPYTTNFYGLIIISGVLGLGTALVYPTFLSTIAQATSPAQRAESIGTFRLWRDLGYAFGAVISGITADVLGIEYAILFLGVITLVSAFIINLRMPKEIKNTKPCVDVNEVKQAIQLHQKIKVIDVRNEEEFKEAHIPDAIHISLQELPIQINQLNKNYQYVITCGKGGGRSAAGAKLLADYGFNAKWLCGGTFGWLNINPN